MINRQEAQYNQMIQAVNERFRSKRDLHKYLTKYEVSILAFSHKAYS